MIKIRRARPGRQFSREQVRELTEFAARNRRLVLFLALFLGGAAAGMLLFLSSPDALAAELKDLLKTTPLSGGMFGYVRDVAASAFSALILLLALFLCGLSAWGAPAAFIIPFFFGLGLGLSEAYYYAAGASGILLTAVLVLPHTLIAALALMLASAETLRMSSLLAGQLLPNSARAGGLWPEFRLYLVRFLAAAGIVIVSGLTDSLIRLMAAGAFA